MQTEPIQLKGGFTTLDPRLDRLPYFDDRSLEYPALPKLRTATHKPLRSNSHNFRKYPFWLDQRREGACVSFGIGHDLMAYPQEIPMTDELCRTNYFEIQQRDPWPGGAYPGASPFYEGTAVLTGMMFYKEYLERLIPGSKWEVRWLFGGDDVITALMYRGVVIGVNWYGGMMNTDAQGFIHPTGRVVGGHCTYLNRSRLKWRKNVTHYEAKDLERELTLARGRNTWGRPWGKDGDFCIALSKLDYLFAQDGEAAVLVRVV